MILVRNEPHITHDGGETWFGGHTYPAPGQKPGPGSAWVCNGLVVTTTWHYYIDPFEPNRHYICYTDIGMARSLDAGKTWMLVGPEVLGAVAEHLLRNGLRSRDARQDLGRVLRRA